MLAVERKGEMKCKSGVKTKKVISLIFAVYLLASIFELLSRHLHSDVLFLLYIGLQLLIAPLLFYAFCRERNFEDKSEAVSNKTAITIFTGVGLMVVLIVVHALHHQ
jgi:uncharacterized membrane protein YidH (DUF202 family)